MSKPTKLQRDVIEAIVSQFETLLLTNDIRSPSHSTAFEYEMFANLDEFYLDADTSKADELSTIADRCRGVWVAISNLKQ
jgi:hypothetical protein